MSPHEMPLQAQRKGVGIAPPHSQPKERPSTQWTGGWVGLMSQSGQAQKILPPAGFNPQNVQPVASHYTNYIIPTTPCTLILTGNSRTSHKTIQIETQQYNLSME